MLSLERNKKDEILSFSRVWDSGQSARPVYGRSWVPFPSGTQIFSFSHARDKLNIPSFLFLFELNIYHLSFFVTTMLLFTIFLSSLSHTTLPTLLILAVCRTRVTTNSVNMTSLATSLPVAQWLERPTGVREVMGSTPVGHSDFFFVPRS